MPLYAYECPKCGHKFEELVSIGRGEAVVCPECGEKPRRAYQGACAFGAKAGASSGGGCCGGHCSGCKGCHHE